jgi:hypothetical protein
MTPIEIRLYCALSLLFSPLILISILVTEIGQPQYFKTIPYFIEVLGWFIYGLFTGKEHPTLKEMKKEYDQSN